MKIYDIVSDLSAEMDKQTNAIITGIAMKQNTISTYSTTLLGIVFNGFCFINLIPHFFDYLMCPYYPALYDGLLSNCYRW